MRKGCRDGGRSIVWHFPWVGRTMGLSVKKGTLKSEVES